MVRTYKRKTTRIEYGGENLQLALKAVNNGILLLRASKQFGIPSRTLRRHRDKKVLESGTAQLGRHRTILPEDAEKEHHDHICYTEKLLHRLTMWDVRRLAFELAEKLGLNHPFNKERRLSGKDWLQGFLQRHPDLSLRKPQATNLARVIGFNRSQVQHFYNVYKDLLSSEEFSAPEYGK